MLARWASRARQANRVGRTATVLIALIVIATTSFAQRYRLPEGPNVPARYRPPEFNDGGFTHCKLMYRSVRSEANGMGWGTDYPYAGINLLTRVREITKTPVSVDQRGEPNYWVVRPMDDALFTCAFTMATDVGTAEFSREEADRLREYLLKGGFLWVDDFWGTPAWEQWSSEMRKVVPEYPHCRRARRPPDPAEHVLAPGDPAGDEHQLLASQRGRYVRTRVRQPAPELPDDRQRSAAGSWC